jgi:glycosyltransferase involved in cell wall biosynthesis
VSSEFLGPFRNGGIGTAYTKLGEVLNDAGHDVTLLYTSGRYSLTEPIEHWIEVYRRRGIQLVPLPESPVSLGSISDFLSYSYRVFLWLRDHDGFDVVHLQECGAVGYHSVLAKHQGLALKDTVTIVGLHGCHRWSRYASGQLASSGKDLEDDFVEQHTAELADIVWSPGHYMLGWVREHGWDLHNRTHIQPYVVSAAEMPPSGAMTARPVREIVLFGRQEVRKGLFLFLDAIDRLVQGEQIPDPDDLMVTFLGKPTFLNGQHSEQIIRDRSRSWPFPTRVLSDRSREEAIEYLCGDGRLAVIPSVDENYPNTVLECLAFGVPFLASRVGSIPEQIHPEDFQRVGFDPNPRCLARRFHDVLRGGQAPARLAFDPEENSRQWVRWHERLVETRPEPAAMAQPGGRGSGAAGLTVSVCIAHSSRPHLLRQALDSIVAQDEPPLEVIVVDDGRPDVRVQRELAAIVRDYDFPGRGWRLLHQEDQPVEVARRLASARNQAARAALGDYLLFLDDDDVAKPHQIATLASVARHTGADVLTGVLDVLVGDDAPGIGTVPSLRWLGSGANHPLSTLYNTIEGTHTMIRRAAFFEAGGFPEECGLEHQEWELLTRLRLQNYRVEMIPEALVWHRAQAGSTIPSTTAQRDYLPALRPHFELIPEPYHPLVELFVGRALAHGDWLRTVEPPPAPSVPAAPQPSWPLRYRIADGLNARLRRLPALHRAGQVSIQRLLHVRRRILDFRFIRSRSA